MVEYLLGMMRIKKYCYKQNTSDKCFVYFDYSLTSDKCFVYFDYSLLISFSIESSPGNTIDYYNAEREMTWNE